MNVGDYPKFRQSKSDCIADLHFIVSILLLTWVAIFDVHRKKRLKIS
jgi:hypothetical protein